mmetsp:Transcript_27070/g.80288  ORF Transcript_27070/g.80288 Transcript_27070/m.80288 type:complete len:214 (+) Transcript_27070:708-1349(+)
MALKPFEMILGSIEGTLVSATKAFASSSGMSNKRFSYAPLKGMTRSSPRALTHSMTLGRNLFFWRRMSFSDMFTRYTAGFAVSSWYSLRMSMSLALHSPYLTSLSDSSHSLSFSAVASSSSCSFFSPRLRHFSIASIAFFTFSRSLRRSSLWMISRSATGSTRSSTWMTSASSKPRHTWKMPSTAEMWERKLLPRPSPDDAPRTRPAMSTTSR